MSKPMIRIHDVENDTVTDREMTDEEFAEFEANATALETLKQSKASA